MVSRRALAVCALIVLLAVLAAGCGSSSSSSSGTTTTTSANGTTPDGGNRGQALAAFQACLAAHGVKLSGGFGQPPNGQAGSGPPQGQPPAGQNRPAFNPKQQKAFAACSSKLPAGARRGFGQGGRPPAGQSNPAFARYTQCLRQHGVTFGAINNQAAFKKASAACAKYAPTPSGGTGGSS